MYALRSSLLVICLGIVFSLHSLPVHGQSGSPGEIVQTAEKTIPLDITLQLPIDGIDSDVTIPLQLKLILEVELSDSIVVRVDSSETTVVPSIPVDKDRTPGRVLILDNPEQRTRLQSLAFLMGVDLLVTDSVAEFLEELHSPDVAGVYINSLYAGAGAELIASLDRYARNGGHAMVEYGFYNVGWHENLWKELFGVAFVSEYVMCSDDTIFLPGEVLPNWLAGFRIGYVDDNENLCLTAYMNADGTSGEQRVLVSEMDGEERLLWYSGADSYITFVPQYLAASHRDNQIDYYDNQAAAITLLQYLSAIDAEKSVSSPSPSKLQSTVQLPDGLTDEHVLRFKNIVTQVANGDISYEDVESELEVMAAEVGKDGIAFLVGRIPYLDSVSNLKIPVETYINDLADELGVEFDMPILDDPIKTGVGLLFGEVNESDLLDLFGSE